MDTLLAVLKALLGWVLFSIFILYAAAVCGKIVN